MDPVALLYVIMYDVAEAGAAPVTVGSKVCFVKAAQQAAVRQELLLYRMHEQWRHCHILAAATTCCSQHQCSPLAHSQHLPDHCELSPWPIRPAHWQFEQQEKVRLTCSKAVQG